MCWTSFRTVLDFKEGVLIQRNKPHFDGNSPCKSTPSKSIWMAPRSIWWIWGCSCVSPQYIPFNWWGSHWEEFCVRKLHRIFFRYLSSQDTFINQIMKAFGLHTTPTLDCATNGLYRRPSTLQNIIIRLWNYFKTFVWHRLTPTSCSPDWMSWTYSIFLPVLT